MVEKNNAAASVEPEFAIQRLYLKDSSFEAPNTPAIFRNNWEPSVDLELQTHNSEIEKDVYEVWVAVTATAKVQDKVAFLVEVKQAGIFTVKNFPAEQTPAMLGVVCPGILFPYLREAVSDLVVRGSFPPLTLDPVNFEALYMQNLQQTANANKESVN